MYLRGGSVPAHRANEGDFFLVQAPPYMDLLDALSCVINMHLEHDIAWCKSADDEESSESEVNYSKDSNVDYDGF